ncbi:hypothetical protein C356_05922 [Cryptococcus neoformans c45]|nr:hypothetical protein C356_05922 [Cryptococcus neoformans var. grubii c45]
MGKSRKEDSSYEAQGYIVVYNDSRWKKIHYLCAPCSNDSEHPDKEWHREQEEKEAVRHVLMEAYSRTEKEISEPSGYRPVPPHAVPDPLQQPQRSPSVPSGLETPGEPSLFVQKQLMLLTRCRIQENTGLLDQPYGDYGEIKLCSSGDV